MPLDDHLILPQAEALIRATGADIRIGGDRAFYVPSEDFIRAPPPSAYFEPINWHRTVFHEMSHWAGAKQKLNRDQSGPFSFPSYCREELVAELYRAFTCAVLSIVTTVRHAEYLAGWVELLREDNRAIVRAASAASKAADYLLAFRDRDLVTADPVARRVSPARSVYGRGGAGMTAAKSGCRAVPGTNIVYGSLAEWLDLVYRIGGRIRCSRSHYNRCRRLYRSLCIADIRLCRDMAALEACERLFNRARSGGDVPAGHGLQREFSRAEIGILLVEIRNRLDGLRSGRADRPRSKGPRFDPGGSPMPRSIA